MPRRSRKRGNGEGSIQRMPNGSWRAILTLGTDPQTGKQRRRSRRAPTQAAAVKALKELLDTHAHLDPTAPQTLAGYLTRWLRSTRDNVEPRTFDSYKGTLERHVIPYLGSRNLEDLKPMHLQGLLDHLAEDVSPKTSNYTRTVLNIALNEAVRWQVLNRNPVVSTRRKKTVTRQATIWRPDQIRTFLDNSRPHRLHALFYVLFATGLRHGELLGLTWDDVDEDSITVRRTVSTRSGQVVEGKPKSAAGRRVVAIDPGTHQVLELHRSRQRTELETLGMTEDQTPVRVFTNRLGNTLDASNVTTIWHRLQAEAGLPRARLHDGRHMHLSMLVAKGIDIRTVADRAGHSDSVLTLRLYSHALEAQRKRAAIPLEELLG